MNDDPLYLRRFELVPLESDPEDDPIVCPGCYAVGEQPCLPGCIDDEMRRALEDYDQEHDFESDQESDPEDAQEVDENGEVWFGDKFDVTELPPPFPHRPTGAGDDEDDEPVPESQRVDALQERAAELSLAERRLDARLERFERSLTSAERALLRRRRLEGNVHVIGQGTVTSQRTGQVTTVHDAWAAAFANVPNEDPRWSEGDRCCRWCHFRIRDDSEHDFCEPDELTEPHEACWSDELLCATCNRWHSLTLIAPPNAAARRLVSAASAICGCGLTLTVAYSWAKRAVVGLRYETPLAPVPATVTVPGKDRPN